MIEEFNLNVVWYEVWYAIRIVVSDVIWNDVYLQVRYTIYNAVRNTFET